MSLDDLIAKLVAAPEGSRELDADLAFAVVQEKHPNAYYVDDERTCIQVMPGLTASDIPNYTTSLDDALTLVPEGSKSVCFDWDDSAVDGSFFGYNVQAATPALALCIAALKARKAMEEA